ncbi:MAG: ATP-binding protein, partial [Bacteroidetes bacterium]|nr:ATP-binding protein [Bacteroidota bacterium]
MLTSINYSEPTVTEEEIKPISQANLPYDYNQLANPRRFEELLYSLIKAKIEHSSFHTFQTVSLMTGVRDKGQDCALFENGRATGVIQCKQYSKNYGKEEFGKEITKFVLYSLLDNRLMGNPNNFTYYIAVSSGFVKNCSDFIDDFNNQILQENNLNNWIDENLKHPTLKALKVESDLSQKVIEVLSKIAVRKIYPQDLDAFFSEPACEHLAKIFFEIRTVTDNTELKKLREELQSARLMTVDKIEQELNRGSVSLRSEANEFDEIPNSHILRDETQKLYNWAIADSPKDKYGKCLNFCLLAGNAGMGKTVILKDLYDQLTEQQEIAVLGLKADKLYAANIKELQNKIGLSLPIYDFIEACKEHNKITLLIIDQIDALSQSMSSDRTFLQVYKDMIENYLYDENIKIIVSVRIFDLHYDPSLRVYKNIQTVTVNPLTNDQVQTELLKIGINREKVSDRLFELLRVPNTLNVFSRIYINDNANVVINSIQGMYQELWKQKVYNIPPSSPNTSAEIKQVLYSIAQKMFSKQRISVPELQFEDQKAQISYLESERLLKKEGKLLQFFHQSFYDFVFAKQFAESEQDLLTYIKNQDQSLTIRSAVKMIVEYLRDFDLDFYQQTLNDLFDDEAILFHIKHLVFSSVLYQTEPSTEEESIVLKLVQNSVVFNNIFFEQAKAEAWLNLALNCQLLDYLKTEESLTFPDLPLAADLLEEQRNYQHSVGFDFLSYFVLNNHPSAWDFLLTTNNQKVYRNILYRLVNWKNPRAFELFAKCERFEKLDDFGYFLTLKNIAKVNPEFSLDKITAALPEQVDERGARHNDFEEREVYKVIVNSIP